MPSVAAASMLCVNARIERAIKKNFDEKIEPDARRILRLSEEGGGNWATFFGVIGGFLILLGVAITLLPKSPEAPSWIIYFCIAFTAFVGLTTVLTVRYFLNKRNLARKEFDSLIASNPDYWLPIAEALKKIILNAGKLDDLWPERQVTKIVR